MSADTPAVRFARPLLLLVSYRPLASFGRRLWLILQHSTSRLVVLIAHASHRSLAAVALPPDALQKPARGCSRRRCAQR